MPAIPAEHHLSRLGVLSLLCGIILAAPTDAGAVTAALSGPSQFTVSDCNSLGLTLRFTSDAVPLAVRTNNPTPSSGAAAVGWGIEWTQPRVSDTSINEYSSAGTIKSSDGSSKNNCPEVGSYKVPLTLSFAGATAVTSPGTPAVTQPANPPTTTALSITLTRTATPTLDIASAVTLPVQIWPLETLWKSTPLPVAPIAVRESSTEAPIPAISAAGGELKNAAGESEGIALVPDKTPVRLEAGQGGQVALTLSVPPAPGTYTSRIVLRAKTLPDKPVDVTLKVRIYWFLLLLTVALGVGLGWWVNVRLAARAAIDAARIAALSAAGAIAARAGAQKDPAVQQRLLGIAHALEEKLRLDATPEAVQADVTAATHAADAIETQATTSATSFAQSLSQIRAVFQPDGHPPEDVVAALLASLIQTLGSIERMGDAGDVEQASRRLTDFGRTLTQDALPALRPWLEAVREALDNIGVWADQAQEPEQTRQSLINAMLAAFGAATAADAVKLSDALARSLRVWAMAVAPRAIATVFQAAAGILRVGGKAAEAAELDAIADDAAHADGGVGDPLAKMRALTVIRGQAEDLLRGMIGNNPALDNDLIAGDFLAAAKRAAPPPKAPPGEAAMMVPIAPLQRQQTPVAVPGPLIMPPRLVLPAQLRVGSTADISIDWAGAAPPAGPMTWVGNPPNAVSFTNQSVNGASVTAGQAGFVTITASRAGAGAISAGTYAGDPAGTTDYRRIARDAGRVAIFTALITAVITTFTGYIVFSSTWFGTTSDVFSAFAWGFFGQFGLDRIRTLTQPITSKAL
jgi:hypothetical protein